MTDSPPEDDTVELTGVKSAKRYQAFVVDNLLSIICFWGTASFVRDLLPKARSTTTDIAVYLSLAVLYLLYFWISETVFSTTPGKAWFGLCVRQIDGSKCGAWAALIRGLSR